MNKAYSLFNKLMCNLATGEGWRKADCVFVLSTGRSGTNTLADLINLSPEITAYHEPPPNLLKERQSAFHEVYDKPRKYARIFTRARSGFIAQTALGKRIYAETSARLTFFAPVISQICPNARFIHLVRHPGDVVRSGMRRKWYEKNGRLDRYRIYPGPEDPFFNQWAAASAFEKICWYWKAYNDFALRFRSMIPEDRILLLKAEELFEYRTEAIKNLFDFLGVECPSESLIKNVLDGKLNQQVAGHFPGHANWEQNLYGRFLNIVGDTMSELGY